MKIETLRQFDNLQHTKQCFIILRYVLFFLCKSLTSTNGIDHGSILPYLQITTYMFLTQNTK